MEEFPKFILTATTANSWIYPDIKNWAQNPQELVKDAVECYEAGAAITHVHLPRDFKIAADIVAGIRDKCDVIIQAGMSSFPIEERQSDFDAKPDMLSVISCHHAEHFANARVNVLHPLGELEAYCIQCSEKGIKPEWEVWHNGSYWNLQYLIDKGILKGPHVLTHFFNWPGGTWSPATPDEFFHRIKYMPKNSRYTVSIMGKEQRRIAQHAIINGGNIRVGTEDYPFISEGIPAKNNAEIVSQWIYTAKQLGREIADPKEARKILGI